MKQFSYIAISAILLCSCSLNEAPQDQIPEEAAYTSAEKLYQNAVATLYNYMGGHSDGEGLQGTCRGVYDLQTFGSDEAMLPTRGIDWFDGGLWQEMYKHSWNPGRVTSPAHSTTCLTSAYWSFAGKDGVVKTSFASANSAHSITGLMPLTKATAIPPSILFPGM